MISLYIHFPFCLYKCHYCDFNSHATPINQIPFADYVRCLINEIQLRRQIFEQTGKHFFPPGQEVKSVFLGGGTPSLFSAACIADVLQEIGRVYRLSSDAEITLEANPKTLTPEKLADYRSIGINRLSVGIQSLHDRYLQNFGRIHSASDARQTLDWVARAGFGSWNADLIFGFPGQTMEEWQCDLAEILEWGSPHLSCYAFTVEEEAPYGKMVSRGLVAEPDQDTQAGMLLWNRETLGASGLVPYEISNFSRSGHACRHNLNYWNYQSYLGLGAGAVSFFGDHRHAYGYRTQNEKIPARYMDLIKSTVGDIFFTEEHIDDRTAAFERMMMGLRLEEGVPFDATRKNSVIDEYVGKGWLVKNSDATKIRVTDRGRLFADQILCDLL